MTATQSMTSCSDGRHVIDQPGGPFIRLESSRPVSMDFGPNGDPEWFTCCEVNALNEARAAGVEGAVPIDEAMRWYGDEDDDR